MFSANSVSDPSHDTLLEWKISETKLMVKL